MNRQRFSVLLTFVVTAVVLAACVAGAAAMAPTPEQAVRQAVEASGAAYAGECAATRSPQDIGKVCATSIAERDETRAYLTGRTFSEYSTWVFVRRIAAGWTLAGTAPLDFFATEEVIPWPE